MEKVIVTLCSSEASTPGDSSKEQAKENVNYEKVDKFRKDSAGALFILNKCINSFDRDFIKEHATNKAKLTALLTKYKKAKLTNIWRYEIMLTHWKKDMKMSIDHSWMKLKELCCHFTEADPNTNIDETKLFGYLMQGLLEEYGILKIILDV